MAFAQLLHVFNMRERMNQPVNNEISRNPWIWTAVALCTTLVLAAVFVPPFAGVLALSPLPAAGWWLVASASVVPLLFAPLVRLLVPDGQAAQFDSSNPRL
jgi:Ca2+-transporting ATPase